MRGAAFELDNGLLHIAVQAATGGRYLLAAVCSAQPSAALLFAHLAAAAGGPQRATASSRCQRTRPSSPTSPCISYVALVLCSGWAALLYLTCLQLPEPLTGKAVKLSEYAAGAPATLVMFICNHWWD
mgnify:CR=1 FL=1